MPLEDLEAKMASFWQVTVLLFSETWELAIQGEEKTRKKAKSADGIKRKHLFLKKLKGIGIMLKTALADLCSV